MTTKELSDIENAINGKVRPEDVWFIETISTLICEIRRLKKKRIDFTGIKKIKVLNGIDDIKIMIGRPSA